MLKRRILAKLASYEKRLNEIHPIKQSNIFTKIPQAIGLWIKKKILV